jgi:hypothetical protein
MSYEQKPTVKKNLIIDEVEETLEEKINTQQKEELLYFIKCVASLKHYFPSTAEQKENFLKKPLFEYKRVSEDIAIKDIVNHCYSLAKRAEILLENIK